LSVIDVLVNGAAGRMGNEALRAVTAAEGMRVVAAVDPPNSGKRISDGAGGLMVCSADLSSAIAESSPHVMLDFTHPSAVEDALHIALAAGIDCVVGTTGVSEEALRALISQAPEGTTLFLAPNFAIGAVLMMRFAEQAARFMPHVEIIELHHDQKADAPSGTALRTAGLIASARSETPQTSCPGTELSQGARGACVEGVAVHSVRLPGLVAHQEIVFGDQGQTLTIRHDSLDRTSFMPGVILAIREVGHRSGFIVGLENLMGA